jgi:DNA-binding transcriptional regulator YhcF (GntR family)
MNFVIHKGSCDPVSAQIARQIERGIRQGEFLPGERLPSVRELRRQLGVAFNTVLRAYADLAKTGFAYSVPSTGTFVAHHAPPPPVQGNDDEEWRERRHWIRLADALIVQSERCGVEIDDALAEVSFRARHRASRIKLELAERNAKTRRAETAKAASLARQRRPGPRRTSPNAERAENAENTTEFRSPFG